MLTRHLRTIVACGAVAALCVVADASLRGQQSAPLPPASDLVARYVRAIGGEAALRRITSIHARGTFEIVGTGISGTLEMLSARPAKALVKVQLPGDARVETGFDGKVGWEIDPQRGPAVLASRRLSEVADDAWFDAPLHKPDHVRLMTTAAKTTYDRRPAYQVKVVFVSGNETVEYYDVETGLLIGTESTRDTTMGLVPSASFLREYKKFGPMMQPTVLSQRFLGIDQVLRLTSFEYDAVPPSTFDIPVQIKALIK